MPDVPDPVLDAETIRRFAREEIMLALSPAEVDALRNVLNSLLGRDPSDSGPATVPVPSPRRASWWRNGRDDRPDDDDGAQDRRFGRRRELTAVEVTRSALDRIGQLNGTCTPSSR